MCSKDDFVKTLLLTAQAIPEPPASVVTAELVGSIVGGVIALLLAIILLAFAVYTKRYSSSRTVSRDEYFFEALNILIITFCACAMVSRPFKHFSLPYTFIYFYLLL
jgi:Ca2+/Na+ antiporter